jgi:ankyrin repeat protein
MDELLLIINEECDHTGGHTTAYFDARDRFPELITTCHHLLTQEMYNKLCEKIYDHYDFEYFKILIGYNKQCINRRGYQGSTILHTACEWHPGRVQFLLDNGADVNVQKYYHDIYHAENEPNGYSPIVAADRYHHPEIVQLLLDHGAIDNREEYRAKRELELQLSYNRIMMYITRP